MISLFDLDFSGGKKILYLVINDFSYKFFKNRANKIKKIPTKFSLLNWPFMCFENTPIP